MDEILDQIALSAEDAVAVCEYLRGEPPDYSEASLAVVDDVLLAAAGWDGELTIDQLRNFALSFGCYVLEVARREFGGRYCWFEGYDMPVLVVGEPAFRIALLTWDQVRCRLAGDASCSLAFLYCGFAERARRAEPGTDAMYV